jgi:hypothetical protein
MLNNEVDCRKPAPSLVATYLNLHIRTEHHFEEPTPVIPLGPRPINDTQAFAKLLVTICVAVIWLVAQTA